MRNEVFLSHSELKFKSSSVPPQRSMYAATGSLCTVSLSKDDQNGGEAMIVLRQWRYTWVVKTRSLWSVRKDGIGQGPLEGDD